MKWRTVADLAIMCFLIAVLVFVVWLVYKPQ
jgi:hypothetical protein